MGICLNPGAMMLRKSRASKVYVDKSMLVARLNELINTEQAYVCVSRPRRFGKSMAANMVCAYYDRTVDGAREFAGLKVAADPSFEAERNRYDVVRINMQDFLSSTHVVAAMLADLQETVSFELQVAYPDVRFRDLASLHKSMADVYSQSGRQFVIVIDEWDCPMREMQGDHASQESYLDFLLLWLKDKPYVALCYMTGILPIKKYGTHSALNMFDEYSMVGAGDLAPFVGFTEAEVRSLCDAWGRDFETCRAWYDGYRVPGSEGLVVEAYNPRAIVGAMISGNFMSYWNQTESYVALQRYVDLDMDGLHERIVALLAGGGVAVQPGMYTNDMAEPRSADDVLILLVHLGYLTFEWTDELHGRVFVPNREVMGEFADSMRRGTGWHEVLRSIEASDTLLKALVVGDAGAVAEGVQLAHEDASSILKYNDENSLACTLRLAFFSLVGRWRLVREAPAGKGFADMTLIPLRGAPAGTPGVVIELKYGGTPGDALAQIRERGYDRALEGLARKGEVILCGIAYDPKTKSHGCKIERAVMR